MFKATKNHKHKAREVQKRNIMFCLMVLGREPQTKQKLLNGGWGGGLANIKRNTGISNWHQVYYFTLRRTDNLSFICSLDGGVELMMNRDTRMCRWKMLC